MSKQEQWTPEQYRQHEQQNRKGNAQAARLKFGNIHTVIDGIRFDSKKEAEYYGRLKIRVKIGQLSRFDCHVKFPLIVNGELIAVYEADFVLYHPNGTKTVVDVKSKATEGLPVFRIKKALMWAIHKIKIQIA